MKIISSIIAMLIVSAVLAAPARNAQQRAADIIDAVKGEPVSAAISQRIVDAWCQSEGMPGYATATTAQKARFFVDWFRQKFKERLIYVESQSVGKVAETTKANAVTAEATTALAESP